MCNSGFSLCANNLNVEVSKSTSNWHSQLKHGLDIQGNKLKVIIQRSLFQVICHQPQLCPSTIIFIVCCHKPWQQKLIHNKLKALLIGVWYSSTQFYVSTKSSPGISLIHCTGTCTLLHGWRKTSHNLHWKNRWPSFIKKLLTAIKHIHCSCTITNLIVHVSYY